MEHRADCDPVVTKLIMSADSFSGTSRIIFDGTIGMLAAGLDQIANDTGDGGCVGIARSLSPTSLCFRVCNVLSRSVGDRQSTRSGPALNEFIEIYQDFP
jgi:hypothetical protein